MSEIEDAILVDRMDDIEAEQAAKHTADLLDFGDAPAVERDESPISSATDQLLDFTKPDLMDVAGNVIDVKDTKAQTSHDGIQEIPQQEPVTITQTQPSSKESMEMEAENQIVPEDVPEKKGKCYSLTFKSNINISIRIW